MTRVLIVGAQPHSLGEAVATEAQNRTYEVKTAGIKNEQIALDVLLDPMSRLVEVMNLIQPSVVVCTVGLNMPRAEAEPDVTDWYRWHMETNVTGPMRLLEAMRTAAVNPDFLPEAGFLHYVAISSNSARLPRSGSAAYCASKAALSMAIRVTAREGWGGDHDGILVYGYEPGLLAGTPMTQKTQERWAGQSLHRMRGWSLADGIPTDSLAALIVRNFSCGPAINGTLIPYDEGEV